MKFFTVFVAVFLLSCADAPADTNAQTNAPASKSSAEQPSAAVANQTPLTGTYWKVVELNGKSMEGKTEKEMYLFLDPSSAQFKSHSGCSMVLGEAKRGGANQMWFINLLPTTNTCKTPEIDAEFQKALEVISEYSLNGNVLLLSKKGSEPVMKLTTKG